MQARLNSPTSLPTFGLTRSVRRRAWALLLAVAVGLASFMHVAHSHGGEAPAKFTQTVCSFCTVFDRSGGAPPPAPVTVVTFAPFAVAATVVEVKAPAGAATRSPCHPRAPPALQA